MPTSSPVSVPISWLLAKGGPSLQYRALAELAGFGVEDPQFQRIPYASRDGWHLLLMQKLDGTWPGGMLGVPPIGSLEGVGTILAYRRLIELGWDPESPALTYTKRLLFRLLAEDDDPSVLAELMPEVRDADMIRRARRILREAAAAALAQSGYEDDPRLRGAANRLLDRLSTYLRSPLSAKPWIRIGNQHVLPAEAHAPSFYTLIMLAHMPHFRSEHSEVMDRLFAYLSQPWPRQQPMQQVGEHLVEQPHLVLGDFLPTRNVMDADMTSSLAWLEIMARMGFIRHSENWTRLLDRLLDDRDRKHIWHPPRSVVMPEQVPSWSWPTMPLQSPSVDSDVRDAEASANVTFRLALIAALAGRQVELV